MQLDFVIVSWCHAKKKAFTLVRETNEFEVSKGGRVVKAMDCLSVGLRDCRFKSRRYVLF